VLVAGVLVYHLSGAMLPSATGEVAVITFFSLSGFLITFLLADEFRANGSVQLRAFLARRARRLLPALGFMLGLWTLVALLFGHDVWITSVPAGGAGGPISPLTVAETAGAAMGYVTNWINAFPASHLWAGYSPLGHLWSLAVEEQFYLVWAPVLLLLMRRRRTGLWIGLLALALMLEPALLYHQGTNRVYFGTDTRMSALLLGAALGWCWRAGQFRCLQGSVVTPALGAASVVGLLVAGVGFRHQDVAWQWVGGIELASVCGAGLVLYLAVQSDDSPVSKRLSRPVLRWAGQRSYAIYLWSYVFNTWFRSLGPACALLTVSCTVAAAEVSYRLVEQPALAWAGRGRRGLARRGRLGAMVEPPAVLEPVPATGGALVASVPLEVAG